MIRTLTPCNISGTITAPSSKSYMQRALALALLTQETTILDYQTLCDDSEAALEVIRQLGAKIIKYPKSIEITGTLKPVSSQLHCGESGLGIRMFTPIASLCEKEILLWGRGSLTKRPVSMIETPLKQLGVHCETRGGFLPIRVKGPLGGGIAHVDGSLSSQFLTGLLIALPFAKSDSTLIVKDLQSKPYIDMTLDILKQFMLVVENNNYQEFKIKGNQKAFCKRFTVEGDWSSISFFLVAGAIGGEVTVKHINKESFQADKEIITALKKAGASVTFRNRNITVRKKNLKGFEFDATDCPDLFPPIAILACNCKGKSVIRGVSRLKHKESNRAKALYNEISKLGGSIEIKGDRMEIIGRKLQGGTIYSHNDHRIAMAGAIASITAEKEISIQDSECISKSYPHFFDDFMLLTQK